MVKYQHTHILRKKSKINNTYIHPYLDVSKERKTVVSPNTSAKAKTAASISSEFPLYFNKYYT